MFRRVLFRSSSEDLHTAVAKVADFGVSTTLEKTKMSTASAKCVAGTLAWNASETFDGKYSEKSDTYAFAMVMYETLTFLRPHAGKSTAEITRMGMEKFKVNKSLEKRGSQQKNKKPNGWPRIHLRTVAQILAKCHETAPRSFYP